MNDTHRLHALLPAEGGLQLWVEKVEGRSVVTSLGDVPSEALPPEVWEILRQRPLRSRGDVAVATPKGRLKRLPIPTAAWTPRESLPILSSLNTVITRHDNAPGLSPEVGFVTSMYRLCLDIVRAGRVMIRLDMIDGEYFPRWVVSAAGSHHLVLQKFRDALPEVLRRNGSEDVVADFANDLVHAIATEWLQAREGAGEGVPALTSAFVTDLIAGDRPTRATHKTVSKLNEWRKKAEVSATALVLMLSSPDEAVEPREDRHTGTDEPTQREPMPIRWRLELASSVNDGPCLLYTSPSPRD